MQHAAIVSINSIAQYRMTSVIIFLFYLYFFIENNYQNDKIKSRQA